MNNNPSKLWIVSIALVVLIGLPGCVVSETPLSDAKTAKVDNRLSGVWRGMNERGQTIITACSPSDVKGHPAGMMGLEWIEMDEPKESFSRSYRHFYTSDIGGLSFMNVIIETGRTKPLRGEARPLNFQLSGECEALLSSRFNKVLVPNYCFYRYEISRDLETKHDTLTMWEVSEEIAKEAIKSGAIKGTAADSGFDDPVFKDSSENLAKFFQSDLGKKLFSSGRKQVLIRLK